MKAAWLALLLVAAPAAAREPLVDRVAAKLREAGPGARFGLVVADESGRELVAIAPDDRFVPASNTKIVTVAAAFANLPVDQPDGIGGTRVRLDGRDVVIDGRGDARMSSAADCVSDCLATLADAVAAKTRRVRDVIGDATFFPDERWSPGMSWNNMPTRSGTAIAALSVDDNELAVTVTPGTPPAVTANGYLAIDNAATIGAVTRLRFDRLPGDRRVRLAGTIAADAQTQLLRLGIDDPAHYAAWRFAELLRARGVRVTGTVRARYRPPASGGEPVALSFGEPALAALTPPPLRDDLVTINKASQNVHAEMALRRIGRVTGSGSIAEGQARVEAMMAAAGVERWRYDFADGSGMSSYNRVSPRGMVRLLGWTARQPWAAGFRATLPIAGVDGTLARRFTGTPLEGRLFAKTGTLNQANALAGWLTAASGRTLAFAIYANDMPGDASATSAIDAALNLVAAEN